MQSYTLIKPTGRVVGSASCYRSDINFTVSIKSKVCARLLLFWTKEYGCVHQLKITSGRTIDLTVLCINERWTLRRRRGRNVFGGTTITTKDARNDTEVSLQIDCSNLHKWHTDVPFRHCFFPISATDISVFNNLITARTKHYILTVFVETLLI